MQEPECVDRHDLEKGFMPMGYILHKYVDGYAVYHNPDKDYWFQVNFRRGSVPWSDIKERMDYENSICPGVLDSEEFLGNLM